MKTLLKSFIFSMALLPLFSNAQWQWLNPKPQGGNLNAVNFIDANTGFAVGDKETILKTTNGGSSWIIQNPSTMGMSYNLHAVYFKDSKNGVALSDYGNLLITQNGGAKWSQTYAGSGTLQSIFFADSKTGYIVGTYSTVVKTTDGGNTWTSIDTVYKTLGYNTNLYSVCFTDTLTGYATSDSGKIFKTIDGGGSWTVQSTGDSTLKSIVFVSSSIGFATGLSGNIFKTTDAGKNWIKVSTSHPSLFSICFTSANNGYAVGDKGTILSTSDGGSNWAAQTSNTLNPLNAVNFINSTTGFAVGALGIILKTTNGGSTWTFESSNNIPDLLSVDFINTNIGIAVGINGTIIKTINGGSSFTSQNSGIIKALNSVKMVNANTAYVVGAGGTILKTTDGGSNWNQQTSGTTKNLLSVFFSDANTGYAVGESGTILKSTDAGASWTQQTSGISSALNSVYFPAKDTGWAVGDSGKILSTSDGGKTWNLGENLGNISLRSVFFINSKTGYIAGPGANIYSTQQGIYTTGWMSESAYTSGMTMPSFISSVCMTKDGNGYAVGDGGSILLGPNMWNGQFQHSSASTPLFSVCFPASDTGFAVGAGGVILKTTNGGCGKPVLISSPAKNLTVCNGSTIALNFKASGEPATEIFWLFSADGVTSSQISTNNVLILNSDSVKYGYYSLTVENQCGYVTVDSISINVAYVPSFFNLEKLDTAKNIATFSTKSVKKEGIISKTLNYFWDFDNGQNSNLPNPVVNFKAGEYNVCLTTTDSATGCQAKLCQDYIFGGVPKCKASFIYDTTSFYSYAFNADSTSFANTTYHWEFGNGVSWDCKGDSVTVLGNTSYCRHPMMNYLKEGYYNVKLTVMCPATTDILSDSYEEIIQVGNPEKDCKAGFLYQVDLNTHTVGFLNQSKGLNLNYFIWDFETGDTTSSENPTYTFKNSNFYNVCLNISNAWCKDISCQRIKAGNDSVYCAANFIYTIDSASRTVSFMDKSLGNPTSWNWDFGDGQGSSINTNPSYTYKISGIYQVILKIKNDLTGCISYQNEVIDVASGLRTLKCKFGYVENKKFNTKGVFPVEFKGATYGDPSEVSWDFGDGQSDSTSMTPTHQYGDTGTYNVCMIVKNQNLGQSDSTCGQVKVLSDGITGISNQNNLSMSLNNYPNPMRNSTNIIYTLPSTANVEMYVYDITGNKVASLVNALQSSGKYKIEWNSSDLSNGIYYLQLRTTAGMITNKIIVLK